MKVHSILQLSTIDSVEQAQALNSLGIYTVRDAAEYDGCRHAEYLMASFAQGTTEQAGLEHYVEADALTPPNIDALDELEVLYLLSVSETDAQTLGDVFGVTTLAQLAQFPPYEEARQLVRESVVGTFSEPPSAPEALVPS